jgi:hypothetical protein
MQVTFDLPDEVVAQLNLFENQLPEILKLGLPQLNALSQVGFSGLTEVVEFLASLPTPEAIIALRPSETLQTQITNLLEKNLTLGLTPEDEKIWQNYQYLEHIVRMAKTRAFLKLKETQPE